MNILKRIRNKGTRERALLKELSKEKSILNPKDVAEQFIANKPIINYVYKGHSLFINNENSALYHLVNSTSKIEKLVDSIHLSECKVALDIGGNIGLFTYFLKKKFPEAKVYIFEPDDRLFPVIENNLKGFKNCEIVSLAVSDKDNDEINFYINPKSAQTNSTIKEAVTMFEGENGIIYKKVQTITIDTFIKQKNLKEIDVIKIDIQGSEFTALENAPLALENTKVLIAEICFLMPNTIPLILLLNKYFENHVPVCPIIMGADLKFYN